MQPHRKRNSNVGTRETQEGWDHWVIDRQGQSDTHRDPREKGRDGVCQGKAPAPGWPAFFENT